MRGAKRPIKYGFEFYRLITSPIRLMPDFIIIGAQKCGTTSLFNYLLQHPCVDSPARKELGFFNRRYRRGIYWYRSRFPTSLKKLHRQDLITGEATTDYLCYPHVPKKVVETLPQVKLIVLLRNPVNRAYSHYHHTVRLGVETFSFEEAIEREEERLHSIIVRMFEDEYYYNIKHCFYSYLSRGIYIDQIKNWFSFFPKEQILILRSEDLYAEPSAVFRQVLKFLDLPEWEPENYGKYINGKYDNYNYQKMDVVVRKRLVDYFKPHNERLYEYLGKNFSWNTGDSNAVHGNETQGIIYH
jgi:hypothetical protein